MSMATEKIAEGLFRLVWVAASKEKTLDAILITLFRGKVTTDVPAVRIQTNDPPQQMPKTPMRQVELPGEKGSPFLENLLGGSTS